jgi:hypothetical protein
MKHVWVSVTKQTLGVVARGLNARLLAIVNCETHVKSYTYSHSILTVKTQNRGSARRLAWALCIVSDYALAGKVQVEKKCHGGCRICVK